MNPKKLMGNIIGAMAKTKLLNVFDIFNAMKEIQSKTKRKRKTL
jgi:hypothetical protein